MFISGAGGRRHTKIQQISRIVFEQKGYEVRTAAASFLSVVRRCFPHIPVIAISGEFNGDFPAGLIADSCALAIGFRCALRTQLLGSLFEHAL